MLRLLCVAALLSSSRHAFPALLGADAAIGPYPHMTHASDLCSEEVHGYRRLATDQFAAVSDERQLLQAILNPNVVCAFVVVPRLDLTNDLVHSPSTPTIHTGLARTEGRPRGRHVVGC
jgi:hypothetical protein